MKLRCDGMSPCGSCKKRHTPCNNERRYSADELAEGMEGMPLFNSYHFIHSQS